MKMGHKGCGSWGHGMKEEGDWEKMWDKMDPKEKKEKLKMKLKHLKEKMDWAQKEMKKLEK